MLPGFDGVELLSRIRAFAPEVPALFLTAKDAVQARITGLAAGGDDYVTKPFSMEEVLLRLHHLVQRSGVAAMDSAELVVGDLRLAVRTPALPHGKPKEGSQQGPGPGSRVELRLWRPGQHRRTVHLLPAEKDRCKLPAHDPHGPRRRLRHQAGGLGIMSELSGAAPKSRPRWLSPSTWHLRTKLILVAMALLVAISGAIGLFCYASMDSFLTRQLR